MTEEQLKKNYELLKAIETIERYCYEQINYTETFAYENYLGNVMTGLRSFILEGMNRLRYHLKEKHK